LRRSRPARSPGLTTWRSREQLTTSRRRTRLIAYCLAVLAALWLSAFTSESDADTIVGVS
jgi:hypothetical protein